MGRDAAGLSPESRMAREYEVSERIFDLPVSEQGVLARLAQLLSGLREGDEAEVRGEPGEAHHVRGVINAARVKDRYDGAAGWIPA